MAGHGRRRRLAVALSLGCDGPRRRERAEWFSTGSASSAPARARPTLTALQQAAIDAYRSRYPDITQYRRRRDLAWCGTSNAYGGTGALPAYYAPNAVMDPHGRRPAQHGRELRAPGRDGLPQPPDDRHAAPGRSCAQRLIRTNGMGAQVIEVGTGMNPGSAGSGVR